MTSATQLDHTPVLTEVLPAAPAILGREAQRAVTGIEGNLFGVNVELLHGRAAVELAVQHDRRHDAWLEAAVNAVDDGLQRLTLTREARLFLAGVRRMIVEAQLADAAEDGEIAVADARMVAARVEAKAGAGAIERLLVGRARSQGDV